MKKMNTSSIEIVNARFINRLRWIIVLCCFVYSGTAKSDYTTLISGEPIPCGTETGPLAYPGISNKPMGTAYVYHSQRPDIFILGSHFGDGLMLYKYLKDSTDGIPVFSDRQKIRIPFSSQKTPAGKIIQMPNGSIYGIWCDANTIYYTTFDLQNLTFAKTNEIEIKLPRSPDSVEVLANPDGTTEILLGITDGKSDRPPYFEPDPKYPTFYRDPRYIPYDGAGVWRGQFPYVSLYAITLPKFLDGPVSNFRRISETSKEVRNSYITLTFVNLGRGREKDIITGSLFGGLYYYHNNEPNGLNLEPVKNVLDSKEIVIRHPAIWPCPVAYPNPKTGMSDLIAGAEGGTYYYKFTGKFTQTGCPVYEDPEYVLEQNPVLLGGSLTVPNAVDWDGDGDFDIVSGNSMGEILFFENSGSDTEPKFLPAIKLKAGGQTIHIQAGYSQSVQGPGEARWGYTSPTVADWNNDGLPDIIMSDITAKHTVFMNIGTQTTPRLDYGKPLYLDGLDFHGTWRCKPAIGELDGKTAYIALDDDDEIHLYWQVDIYNLSDGGKLKLNDGSNIYANFLKAGGTGRLKMVLFDWDKDGEKDLIIGTPRHGSVPDPNRGLPWNSRNKYENEGAAVLFMKNLGTNKRPIFEFPKLMKFKGRPIFLGQHECGPAIIYPDKKTGADLIVGDERGRYMFYRHEDITTD